MNGRPIQVIEEDQNGDGLDGLDDPEHREAADLEAGEEVNSLQRHFPEIRIVRLKFKNSLNLKDWKMFWDLEQLDD